MNSIQTASDKTAIGLSLLCAIHCLAFPIAVVALPSLAALPLSGEAFHFWMLAAVIPTSIFALTLGCNNHKRFSLLTTGLIGIGCLIAAIFLGHELDSELVEKSLTTLGAAIIALVHFKNYRLCQQARNNVEADNSCCEAES